MDLPELLEFNIQTKQSASICPPDFWGMTTRLIGALIMVHGDDSGLVLPPAVLTGGYYPIAAHKEGVPEKPMS